MPRILRNSLCLSILLAITALLGACTSLEDERQYDYNAKGLTVTSKVGDMFVVRLPVNFKVSARWQIVELDRSILDLQGEPRQMGNVVAGALPRFSTYYYAFKAKSVGNTTLRMELLPPEGGEALDSFDLLIVVK